MNNSTPDLDILSDVLNLKENEITALVLTVQDVNDEHMSLNILSKLDNEKIIFLLQETLLHLKLKSDVIESSESSESIEKTQSSTNVVNTSNKFIESDQSMFPINPEDMLNGSIIDPIKSDK